MSGRALDSASLIILVDPHPTTMLCRWRMPPVRWWFLAPGQDARASAGPPPRRSMAGPGPTGLAGPRLGGGGPLGLRARARSAWCGRLPVEPAGLPPRHPGAPTLWLSEVPLRALLCPFWVEAAVVPAVVLLGSRALGGLRMFGARVFSVPASCLAGWGCCSPHTLLNVYMEEPYEHKRAHTHQVYTQASTLV